MEFSVPEENKKSEKEVFKMVQKLKATFERLLTKDQHPVIETAFETKNIGEEIGEFSLFFTGGKGKSQTIRFQLKNFIAQSDQKQYFLN